MKGWLLLLALSDVAHATNLRGVVTFPQEGRGESQSGHWRVENGVLPVLPRNESRDAVVVLEGGAPNKKKDDPPTVTVELRGLRFEPRLLLIPVGGTVQFKNSDRVPHTLFIEGGTAMMPAQATPAGQTRAQKFHVAGAYLIRDDDFPHLQATVVAADPPYAAILDDKGGFKLDVPEGKYTVRVFWRGEWVVSQPLTVGPRTSEVNLVVPK